MAALQDVLDAVESGYSMEREHGFLCLDAIRSSTAFFAARQIIAADGRVELPDYPPWLITELYRWLAVYAEDGQLISASSLGRVDHTAVAEQLARVLPKKESLGPSVDLQIGEVRYPSGRVHKYFTYYVPGPGASEVLHGLHREFAGTGALTETEFRHGAAIGRPRLFDQQGQEVHPG